MPEGNGAIYNELKEKVMKGEYNLASGGDTIKTILVSGHTPDIKNHTGYASVSADEYGAGSGYTVGGEVLAGQDVTKDNTNDRGVFDGTDQTWLSLGPLSPAIPSHTIQYDDTHASKLLMAYWELGTTPTNGGNYQLQWGANGIMLLT